MTMGVMTLSRYTYNIITLSNWKLYIAWKHETSRERSNHQEKRTKKLLQPMTPVLPLKLLFICSNGFLPGCDFVIEDGRVEWTDVVLLLLGGRIILGRWIWGVPGKNMARQWVYSIWHPSRDVNILKVLSKQTYSVLTRSVAFSILSSSLTLSSTRSSVLIHPESVSSILGTRLHNTI